MFNNFNGFMIPVVAERNPLDINFKIPSLFTIATPTSKVGVTAGEG